MKEYLLGVSKIVFIGSLLFPATIFFFSKVLSAEKAEGVEILFFLIVWVVFIIAIMWTLIWSIINEDKREPIHFGFKESDKILSSLKDLG